MEGHHGDGVVVTDGAAVVDHLRWLVSPIRRVGRPIGVTFPGESRLRDAASAFVLVRVSFGGTSDAAD